MTETTKIYDAGFIYGIYHQDNLKYIGSTVDFKNRMWNHKSDCYKVKRRKYNHKIYQYIRANGGFENINFKIIDVYYTITKKLLTNIEGEYIKHFDFDNLLNEKIAGRTNSEYREVNKEELNKKNKKYREDNKDKIKVKGKKYYEDNQDKIKAQASRPWTCDICNKTITIGNKSHHLKTTKHLEKLNNINLINI